MIFLLTSAWSLPHVLVGKPSRSMSVCFVCGRVETDWSAVFTSATSDDSLRELEIKINVVE